MRPGDTEYAEIHIYAQDAWHDDAYIIGTREGLTSLMGAIKRALDRRRLAQCGSLEAMAGDGEGYSLRIGVIDPSELPLLQLPYTDEIAADSRADCLRPQRFV